MLQEDEHEPRPDSLHLPGSTLVLRRGEPTAIRVFNRSSQPTQIHWHGLELQSYYDGVVGVGGMPGMPTPAILPGESFEVRITPPRAGSFMYHTHMNDIHQQSHGLGGGFVVLEPDEAWDPDRDMVFVMATQRGTGVGAAMNGSRVAPRRELRVGQTYRLRLMNATLAGTFSVATGPGRRPGAVGAAGQGRRRSPHGAAHPPARRRPGHHGRRDHGLPLHAN